MREPGALEVVAHARRRSARPGPARCPRASAASRGSRPAPTPASARRRTASTTPGQAAAPAAGRRDRVGAQHGVDAGAPQVRRVVEVVAGTPLGQSPAPRVTRTSSPIAGTRAGSSVTRSHLDQLVDAPRRTSGPADRGRAQAKRGSPRVGRSRLTTQPRSVDRRWPARAAEVASGRSPRAARRRAHGAGQPRRPRSPAASDSPPSAAWRAAAPPAATTQRPPLPARSQPTSPPTNAASTTCEPVGAGVVRSAVHGHYIRTLSFSASKRFGPMPLICFRSSTDEKPPCSLRQSRIFCAVAGPDAVELVELLGRRGVEADRRAVARAGGRSPLPPRRPARAAARSPAARRPPWPRG